MSSYKVWKAGLSTSPQVQGFLHYYLLFSIAYTINILHGLFLQLALIKVLSAIFSCVGNYLIYFLGLSGLHYFRARF